MYLVLTALLALNVSSTVIDKFIFLNASLERANAEAEERNVQILEGMRSAVEDKGSKPEDMAVIRSADELRAKTAEVMKQLEDYKLQFIDITGGYEEGHDKDRMHIVGKTDYDGVGNYMMPAEEGGEGHGQVLIDLLDQHREFVIKVLTDNKASDEVTMHIGDLTRDAEEDPVYMHDVNQEGKKWAQLAFEYSPTHAGMATVSELQASILGYETRGLDYLKTRTGMKEIIFDDIKAMVMPVSKYVISGSKYEAEMFIAASSKSTQPTMKYNGTPIDVDPSGVGKVEFVANLAGGTRDSGGAVKKSFLAEITVATAGGDTTYSNTIEYYVVEPAIVITSNTAVSLYRNCANEVRVDVPGLTSNYNPVFGGSGAQLITGKAGEVNIVPNSNARKVVLSVSNAGQKIGDKEFSVKEIPAPEIQVKLGNNEVTPNQPIPTGTPALRVDAVADKDFADGHPKDARFVVLQGEASLLSGGLVRKKIPFRNGQLDLRSVSANVRKGDALVIEIQRVGRRNFQDKDENFPKFQRFVTVTY